MNKNYKEGLFTRKELEQYKVTEEDIKLILEYQDSLPILQHEEYIIVDARQLYEQMKVKAPFSEWIPQQLSNLDSIEGESHFVSKRSANNGGGIKFDYDITVDLAKDIAMTAGTKGGRTNPELKAMSKLVRRYFKLTEIIAKKRLNWNIDRQATIDMHKPLVQQIRIHEKTLKTYLPAYWTYGGAVTYEMNMINLIVIGMSAKEYKKLHGLKNNAITRNNFDEETLEIVYKLEVYDTDLIEIEGIMDTNEREAKLRKYYAIRFADRVAKSA